MRVERVDVFQAVRINNNMMQSFSSKDYEIVMRDTDFYIRKKGTKEHVGVSKTNATFWYLADSEEVDRIFSEGVRLRDPQANSEGMQQTEPMETKTKPKPFSTTVGIRKRQVEDKASDM